MLRKTSNLFLALTILLAAPTRAQGDVAPPMTAQEAETAHYAMQCAAVLQIAMTMDPSRSEEILTYMEAAMADYLRASHTKKEDFPASRREAKRAIEEAVNAGKADIYPLINDCLETYGFVPSN